MVKSVLGISELLCSKSCYYLMSLNMTKNPCYEAFLTRNTKTLKIVASVKWHRKWVVIFCSLSIHQITM